MNFNLAPTNVETSRHASTGNQRRGGSHGANTRANSIPLSPHMSGRALLERGYVTQALIDSTAVLFGFLFLVSLALSVPLALVLFLLANF